MKIEDVIKLFKIDEIKNIDDNRTVIKYKNNVQSGIELGVVFSKSDKTYEVFIHSKINNEIISKLLYHTFDNKKDGERYYSQLEQYIINFNIDEIANEIKKRKSKRILKRKSKRILKGTCKGIKK